MQRIFFLIATMLPLLQLARFAEKKKENRIQK